MRRAPAPGTSTAPRSMGCGASQNSASSASKGWILQSFREHNGPINCSALSDDESLLLTGSEDGTVKMWSTQSEPVEMLGTLVGHSSYITCCTVHGSYIITASADGTMKKWNIADASCSFTFHGHTSRINRIVCNGNFIISSSMDKTIRAWHFHAEMLAPQNILEDIPDEELAENAPEITEERDLDLIEAAILARKFSILSAKDDTVLIKPRESIVSDTGTNAAYDGVSQKSFEEIHNQRKKNKHKECIQIFKGHHKGVFPILFVPFEGDAQSTEDEEETSAPKGDIIISGSFDCSARSWDLYTGRCLKTFKGHTQAVNDLAIDPEAEYLFTGGGDGSIRQWVLRTGECKRVLVGHQGPVVCLITHAKMLYSGSADGTARSWVMEFGESTRVYRGAAKTVECLRYYDRMLYAGSSDTSARMYEAKSGSHKRSFHGHENSITCLEVTRGRLFTGSYDGTLFVWDTTGVVDETVFNVEEEPEDSDIEEDDENVKQAMKILDGFVHGT